MNPNTQPDILNKEEQMVAATLLTCITIPRLVDHISQFAKAYKSLMEAASIRHHALLVVPASAPAETDVRQALITAKNQLHGRLRFLRAAREEIPNGDSGALDENHGQCAKVTKGINALHGLIVPPVEKKAKS